VSTDVTDDATPSPCLPLHSLARAAVRPSPVDARVPDCRRWAHECCAAAVMRLALLFAAFALASATLPHDLSNFQGKWSCPTALRMGRPKVRSPFVCPGRKARGDVARAAAAPARWYEEPHQGGPACSLCKRTHASCAQTVADIQAIVASASRVRVRMLAAASYTNCIVVCNVTAHARFQTLPRAWVQATHGGPSRCAPPTLLKAWMFC
jgi:hypothetical protein